MRTSMLAAAALVAVCGAAGWIISAPHPVVGAQASPPFDVAGNAERGALIFTAGGCASCHASPGQPDHLKLGGGMELKSPFGSFFVPNISPDNKDGIGTWHAADLANAMLAGVSPGGAHYYPAFPYTSYRAVPLADVNDLFAYLHGLAPVAGAAPAHQLPFPFSVRRAVGLWKALFFTTGPLPDAPDRPAQWQRGRLLVEGLGHCAECHSPRNALGAIVAAQRFAGGPNPDGKGWVPNITQHESGLAKWSEKDIVEVLTTGFTPDFDSVGGSMGDVVKNTAALPLADREAIAVYLKSIPPVQGPQPPRG